MIRLLIASLVVALVGCGDDDGTSTPDAGMADAGMPPGDAEVDAGPPADAGPIPEILVDPEAPWPKFRANAAQNGRAEVDPVDDGSDPWVFETGKGIFSTPVIDGDGTVYIGSADRYFYAIDADGEELGRFETGEIIDSSALLDDEGNVYFGSGDGRLYARDRDDLGSEVWTFEAEAASETGGLINWFEGNVAIGTDGTLYVPNDNFRTYGIDREDGTMLWSFETNDQTWSLPALNPATDTLYIGNNYLLGTNVFALNAADGDRTWQARTGGSVAASPMLTGFGEDDLVVVGSFDGFVRAFRQSSPMEVWRFGARDHIYASPGQLSDGTIIQPAADGTVYALDPEDGTALWSFDTREPIRSSPAIDGNDQIYVGSGEGRLFVLNADGTLRWSIRLIDEDRDDLNASPALGDRGVVIAGENGGVFFVPFDYCLRADLDDERCTLGPGESLPDDEIFFGFTTRFGRQLPEPPEAIDANEPLTFSLFVREEGDTTLALIDSESVDVSITPEVDFEVDVSGDRRFLAIIPSEPWADVDGGAISVRVQASYLTNFTDREGLRFMGGSVAGDIDQTVDFDVNPRDGDALALPIPDTTGDDQAVFELSRLAAPLPTILPSYNQIGFDSIHYVIGLVEGTPGRAIAWGVGATPTGPGGSTIIDPASDVRFALVFQYEDGTMTMENREGFTIEFNGFALPFEFFRVATTVDPMGVADRPAALNARAICGEINLYGPFLQSLGYCNPETDVLAAFGAAEFGPWVQGDATGTHSPPEGQPETATAIFETRTVDDEERRFLLATVGENEIDPAAHNLGLLLVAADTGLPVVADYVNDTEHSEAGANLGSVELDVTDVAFTGTARVYVMVDTHPVSAGTIDFE